MAKMGRPRKEIDWVEFEKLCVIHCTLIEISEWFDCCEDTIEKAVKEKYGETFSEVLKKKSSKGKISLRRTMYQAATGGNITMMIWLSKNLLGFSDKTQVVAEVNSKTDLSEEEIDRRIKAALFILGVNEAGKKAPTLK